MTEQELKSYWYPAYAQALRMLQHPDKVTEKEIADQVRNCKNNVFSRLFCLVVWQEVKRQKTHTQFLASCQYKHAIMDIWNLFRTYSMMPETEAFWDSLVDEMRTITNKYGNCPFIVDLTIHVTLEEIERIFREKKATA